MKTLEERKAECRKEIEASLNKYKLGLDCTMVLKAGSVVPVIDLVDLEPKPEIVTPK